MPEVSKPHSTLDEREYLERLFNDDACERLARSNRDYQQSHAEYIVPLAKLLNATRSERKNLEEQLEALQQKLYHAGDMCCRPPGTCIDAEWFSPIVAQPSNPAMRQEGANAK